MPTWRNQDIEPQQRDFIPPKHRRIQGQRPPLNGKVEIKYKELEGKRLEQVKDAKLALTDAAQLKILETVIRTKLDEGTAKMIERAYEDMLVMCHEVNKLQ